jgi:hypothetical protein
VVNGTTVTGEGSYGKAVPSSVECSVFLVRNEVYNLSKVVIKIYQIG